MGNDIDVGGPEDVGSFEWRVTENLLHQFKNATYQQSFVSSQFKTIDGTSWRIKVYPHGYRSPNYCNIGLECVQLNATSRRTGVNWSFTVVEVDWIEDGRLAHTFTYDGHTCGCNAFPWTQLNALDTMTIKCFVEETMAVSEENTYFEWKISNYWLEKWKIAKFEQLFLSPRFHAMGQDWQLGIWPNGHNTQYDIEGTAYLSIRCHADEEKEMNIGHYIGIDALNHCQIDFDGNTIHFNGEDIVCNSPFQLYDIQNESQITIRVKIWQIGSIDRNEGLLITNIYSDKLAKLQHAKERLESKAQTARMEHLEALKAVQAERDNEMKALRDENEQLTSKAEKANMEYLDAMITVQPLEKEIAELQTENSNLQTNHLEAMITVQKELDKEMRSLRHENAQLKSKAETDNMDHMVALQSLDSFMQSLQTEIARLKTENSEVNEECKETKLELIRVKQDLRKVKVAMNTTNYLEWTHLEVVDWITSIHDGAYAKYEHDLRLLFAKENVNGAVLSKISKSDLKEWGIRNFAHRSNLYKQIQKLVKQQSKIMPDIERQGDTAYI